jgi:phage FluMu protein Com
MRPERTACDFKFPWRGFVAVVATSAIPLVLVDTGAATLSVPSPMEYWALLGSFILLVLIEVFLCACAVLWMCAWRIDRLNEAEMQRYRQWCCPNCGRPFGPELSNVCLGVCPGADGRDARAICHVVIHCPHCRYLNSFDPSGRPEYPPGVYYNADERQREEEPQRVDGSRA